MIKILFVKKIIKTTIKLLLIPKTYPAIFLALIVKSECRLYADGRKLIGVNEKDEDVVDIEKDIDSMQSWAKTWQM